MKFGVEKAEDGAGKSLERWLLPNLGLDYDDVGGDVAWIC